MLHRRRLLISGAAAAVTPWLTGRVMAGVSPLAPLRPGARIRAVNPGTWIEPERDLTPLISRCAAEGWRLEIPDSVMQQWRYFSATDRNRAADLTAAWRDPTVDAVFYLGGGWGGAGCWKQDSAFLPGQNGPLAFLTAAHCCWPSGQLDCLGRSMAPWEGLMSIGSAA